MRGDVFRSVRGIAIAGMVLAKTTLKPAVETNTMVDFRVQTIHQMEHSKRKKKKEIQFFRIKGLSPQLRRR